MDGAGASQDRTLRLADGRRLGYRISGAANGFPVIALHGTPGSRLKFGIADAAARRRGLMLVGPDRWGYGLSEAPARPRLADYGEDIRQLADALGLEQMAVFGVSGGGPFAVAAAAALGDRVRRLALVAPVGRLATEADREGVGAFHRLAFRGLAQRPGVMMIPFSTFRALLGISRRAAVAMAAARAGPADWRILSTAGAARDLGDTFRAGLSGGCRGPVLDMQLFSDDWFIDAGRIAAEGRVWLGSRDRNVPKAAAMRLAAELPRCEMHLIEGAGHFWIVRHFEEVLGWLAEERLADVAA